jgi:hypothetical protein
MAAITTFELAHGISLRALLFAGEPWFVAKDVCQAFGSANKNIRLELSRGCLVDEQIRTFMLPGQKGRPSLLVSESGLYTFMLSSSRPEARDFQQLVVSQVLPSIRKNNIYIAPEGALAPWLGNTRGTVLTCLPRPAGVVLAAAPAGTGHDIVERRQPNQNGQPLRLAYLAVDYDDSAVEHAYGSKVCSGARRMLEARLRRALRETDLVRRQGTSAGFRVMLAMQDGRQHLDRVGRRVAAALQPALEIQGQTLQLSTHVRGRFAPDQLVADPSRLQRKLMDAISRIELFRANEDWDHF